jgi:flavin reductase (DIM6/NTAB) family NADH-FMN oxidoreductase RutF
MDQFHSYDPEDGHRLPHDPIKAIIAPRPIGWMSTVDGQGNVNLAPYSFFNLVSSKPPMVMFSSEGWKDSVANAKETGEFTWNLATLPLSRKMNETSREVESGIDEMALAKLEALPSGVVQPPRVAASPASFECRVIEIKALSDINGVSLDTFLVLGQVIMVHIDKCFLFKGRFDLTSAKTIARAGYRGDYIVAGETFEILSPEESTA